MGHFLLSVLLAVAFSFFFLFDRGTGKFEM